MTAEPLFFKNTGTLTVVLQDNYFVQVHKRKTVRTARVGQNALIVEDAVLNDEQITEDEFLEEFKEHMNEMSRYIEMIKLKT